MEGSYWLRIGTIAAMAASCVYVLLPSFVVDREIDVDVNSVVARPGDTQAWLTTADNDPDPALATQVDARLRAAGVAFEQVKVDNDHLVVSYSAGTSRAQVLDVARGAGTVSVFPVAALAGFDPAAGAEGLKDLAVPSPDAAVSVKLAEVRPVPGQPGTWTTSVAEFPAGAAGLAVAVGDHLAGLVSAPSAEGASSLTLGPAGSLVDVGVLAAPELAEAITPWVAPDVAAAATPKADAEPPAWWEGLLPKTALNLGLDLQGGIDLTLQVDLDEAVFAQVRRDQSALRDQAVRDNFEVELSRDRSRPRIRASSPRPFAELKTWMDTNLRTYAYIESVEEDGKSWASWELREEADESLRTSAVDQVLETLRKRVDSTGVREPTIVKMPGGRINIQLPGVQDAQSAVDAIGTQAILEFRLVDKNVSREQAAEIAEAARAVLPPEQFDNDVLLNEWLQDNKKMPPERALLWEYDEQEPGKLVRSTPYLLYDRVLLNGSDVARAGTGWDQNQEPYVSLEFKPQGARVFCDVTTTHVKEQFAIILDRQIRSAPSIREKICGGSASIQMGGSSDPMKDANTLALVLRTGSLTAPVDIGELRKVGPSLGADAIDSGIWGSLFGGLIVTLFMGLWYRTAGMVANIALALNVMLVFTLLALFGATLTLPGIAGVALTIGMAVDANIIIYERIREELAVGRTARSAVDNGYNMGLTAVLDANLTTGIAGVVLYSYGTGPIKGFAVTLLIGIITTIITGVFVTRWMLEILTRNSNARLGI